MLRRAGAACSQVVGPIVFNAIFYWMMDNFIKARHPARAADRDSRDEGHFVAMH